MNRDMDLVRRIVLATGDMKYSETLDSLDGVDAETFGQHAIWLQEAGLIKAIISEYQGSEPPSVWIQRLTWAGADFADAVRSDTLWKKAKETLLKPSMSFTFGLLKEWLSAEIREGFPALRGQLQQGA